METASVMRSILLTLVMLAGSYSLQVHAAGTCGGMFIDQDSASSAAGSSGMSCSSHQIAISTSGCNQTESAALCNTGTGGSCPGYECVPPIGYPSTNFLYSAPAKTECPNNFYLYPNGQCKAAPPTCLVNTPYPWEGTSIPTSGTFCAGYCEYILPPTSDNPDVSSGITMNMDGQYIGNAVATGNNCTPNSNPLPQPAPDDQCATKSSGATMCLKPNNSGCGTFTGHDGVEMDVCIQDAAPDGQCTTISGYAYLCALNGTPPALPGGAGTPELQGTVEGQPAVGEPDVTNNVYAPSVQQQNTLYQNGNSTPGSGGGGSGSCGGEGQPPCKIDESGTEARNDDTFTGQKQTLAEQLQQLVDDTQGADMGEGNWGDFNPFSDVVTSSCQSITWGIGNHQVTFPGDACPRFETLKGILAWVFYIYTAFTIFAIATQRPAA